MDSTSKKNQVTHNDEEQEDYSEDIAPLSHIRKQMIVGIGEPCILCKTKDYYSCNQKGHIVNTQENDFALVDNYSHWLDGSVLESAFSQLPEKDQSWQDLHRLTHDESNLVRLTAVRALGSSFLNQVTDKEEVLRNMRNHEAESLGKLIDPDPGAGRALTHRYWANEARRLRMIHTEKDETCEKSPNHVHIKIVGRKQICFSDVSESETIGTLTGKIADDLGVDKKNWGFYVAGPKTLRVFLPNSAKVREIKLNHDKSLHFLPRTVIR